MVMLGGSMAAQRRRVTAPPQLLPPRRYRPELCGKSTPRHSHYPGLLAKIFSAFLCSQSPLSTPFSGCVQVHHSQGLLALPVPQLWQRCRTPALQHARVGSCEVTIAKVAAQFREIRPDTRINGLKLPGAAACRQGRSAVGGTNAQELATCSSICRLACCCCWCCCRCHHQKVKTCSAQAIAACCQGLDTLHPHHLACRRAQ